MLKEKFNYQIMFSLEKNQKQVLVFSGETELNPRDLFKSCLEHLSIDFCERASTEFPVVQFFYQPINKENYETSKK